MESAPLVLWSDGDYRCVMRRVDDRFELLMYRGSRIDRSQTCSSEHRARNKAQAWVAELEEIRQQEATTG